MLTLNEAAQMLELAGVTEDMRKYSAPWKWDEALKDVVRGVPFREVAHRYWPSVPAHHPGLPVALHGQSRNYATI